MNTDTLRERLAARPRAALAHLPTPLEPLARFSAELGSTRVWVKRDDCTGLGLGGNKVRKLEFLIGEALENGADTVLTTGAVQSNHARQTAAAAARTGLRCELVLPSVVESPGASYERSGNRLLDDLLGAEVFPTADVAGAGACIRERLAAAKSEGRVLVAIPPGGSSPTGTLGYVAAALELLDQLEARELDFDRILIAASTGGTAAGLAAGLALAGSSLPITCACVAYPQTETRAAVEQLFAQACAELGRPDEKLPASVGFIDALGAGYGIPSAAGLEAIRRLARSEGLLLDPVYTGKAMATLLGSARVETVLFWHTGGAPGLFAYEEALTSAASPGRP